MAYLDKTKIQISIDVGFGDVIYPDNSLNARELKEAVRETFVHRGTGFDDIVVFNDSFPKSVIHQSRWNSFMKKKKAMVNVELRDAAILIKNLMEPIVVSIKGNIDFDSVWDNNSRSWK